MQHRGEIVEKAIRYSGIPITTIAKKLGKTRQWVYLMFDNPSVPLDTVIALGRAHTTGTTTSSIPKLIIVT